MENITFFSRNVRLFSKAISLLGSLLVVFSFINCTTEKKKGVLVPALVYLIQSSSTLGDSASNNKQNDNQNPSNNSNPTYDQNLNNNSSGNQNNNQNPPPPSPLNLRVFCNYESKFVHVGATITYSTPDPLAEIYIGSSYNVNATEPDFWVQTTQYTFTTTGTIKMFSKPFKDGQFGTTSDFVYQVVNDYPIHTDTDGGIPFSSSSFVAWADGYENYIVGLDVNSTFQTPNNALGTTSGIVSLGNHGRITLKFSMGIKDGPGYDFAVFENGFISGGSPNIFAELGYVEVSSDGINFVRFDNVSRTSSPVGAFGTIKMTNVYGLAGYYPSNYGNQFDLNWLKNKQAVVEGLVDLNNIKYVRIVDISGAPDDSQAPNYYRSYDSFGNVIYDAFKTTGSGGFDLDAIGVLNKAN